MFRLLAVFLGFLCLAPVAQADERILSFDSQVVIAASGDLDVTETICVNVEGNRIKRGIFRDFPTRYLDRKGQAFNVGFSVVDVLRDGAPSTFVVESIDNGKRVRIGDADIFLPNGPTTYTIRYTTTRQIGFFDEYDELYWNVTGNAWEFPIDTASVEITLPDGGSIRSTAGYTGTQGSTGKDYRIETSTGQVFRAVSTRALGVGEGLTVAVSFPKGLVSEPTAAQRNANFVVDNLPIFIMGIGTALVLFYYWRTWRRVGRDPEAGVIVPLFRPPEGLGPAAARFIREQGYDNEAFSSAVLSLAVKKRLKISDENGRYTLEPRAGEVKELTRAEAVLLAALGDAPLVLEQGNHQRVAAAVSAVNGALDSEYRGAAFVTNRGWFALGFVLSVLVAGATFLTAGAMGLENEVGAVIAVPILGILLFSIRSLVMSILRARGFWAIIALFRYVFILPLVFSVGGAFIFGLIGGSFNWPIAGIAVAGLVLAIANLLFFNLLTAPTVSGRRMLDKIEGFRMYLATTEEERLNLLHPPERTPELFEKYLPYALALGCANEWSSSFADVLARAGTGAPEWYSGSSWNASRPSAFANALGSGVANATALSSQAPGSTSGSSGGGFSGGGGGGGGGGGW